MNNNQNDNKTEKAEKTVSFPSTEEIKEYNDKYKGALIKTSLGNIQVKFYAEESPKTVANFLKLADLKFYDGVTFHRVLDGFVAQGGDPTGTGAGGPGYEFVNEDSDLKYDKAGVVAMANAGRDTNGSQFFITYTPLPNLNGGYTIFGQVTDGMDVVNGITRRDPSKNPKFTGDVIEMMTLIEED